MSTDPALDAAMEAIEGAEAAGAGGRKMSWDEYSRGERLFDNLLDIRQFTLVLDLAPLPELASREIASGVATDMYGIVLRAVEEAGFFQQDSLTIRSDASVAAVLYEDDVYDFLVQVSYGAEDGNRQGQLTISRQGSRFEDFHKWFAAIEGQIPELVKGILSILSDHTGREIQAFRGQYQFRFLLYELRSGDAQRAIRNSDVIRKLIRGVPDDDGVLSEADDVVRSAGRIDVNLSRWVNLGGKWRLERYIVEAPGNKQGAGLWLVFSYAGETYSMDEARVRFEHEPFLAEAGRAYVNFLRDKALGRFLAGLLQDVTFRSTAGNLP